jgi:hypothetical protein
MMDESHELCGQRKGIGPIARYAYFSAMKRSIERMTRTLLASMAVFSILACAGCNDDQIGTVDYSKPSLSTDPQMLGDWFEQLTALVRSRGISSPEASRIFAYASIAFYEGYVNSDPEMRSLEGQIPGLDGLPRPDGMEVVNHGIIAEAAMTEVLNHAFRNEGAFALNVIRSTYQNHETRYRDLGVTREIADRSRDIGSELGQAIVAWMDQDGYEEAIQCQWPGFEGENVWRPTPPANLAARLPCWGQVRPFTFTTGQMGQICLTYQPIPVSTDTQSPYMEQVGELLVVVDELTDSQKAIARHWDDGAGSFTAPGHYMSLFRQLIAQHKLNGRQTATMFAQLCIAMADVNIVVYREKYLHGRPRPVTFIRDFGLNEWQSFNVTPPTPEYPSERAALGYAAGQVFTNIYGNLAFTDDSQYLFQLPPREYASFNAMAHEVASAQVYGGTNYRATVEATEYIGRCIAQRSNALFMNQ